MFIRKPSAFSPCGEYFACYHDDGILIIWETSSNNVKQECNVNTHLKHTCSSMIWGSFSNTNIENINDNKDGQLLVLGTQKGTLYLFDQCTGRFLHHFVTGHTDAVNDLSFEPVTNYLFSCSSDRSVIIWDTVTGEIIQKWDADDEAIYSICVIDSNNLLTGSTSILWWNIKEQNVIKKFSNHQAPVTILSVANCMEAFSSTYFLSAAAGESKINAWCLSEKNSKSAAASFLLPDEPQNFDTNKCFSKDNPLLLSAVTKNGSMVLFQHVLNGTTKNLTPQMTLLIMSKASNHDFKPSPIPVISSKLMECAESCIIAYGSCRNTVFESVNIFDCPKTLTLSRENPLLEQKIFHRKSDIKLLNNINQHIITNGEASPKTLSHCPKRRKHKEADLETINILQRESVEPSHKVISCDNLISSKSPPNVKKKQKLAKKMQKKSNILVPNSEEHTVPTDPSEMVNSLLRGIEEESSTLINTALQCDNTELIRSSVRQLPLSSLNLILLELYRRLILQEKRYNSSLRKWLKEILAIHLPYLNTCNELTDILNRIKSFIDSRKIGETLLKMNVLRGLLKVQLQTVSSTKSESSSSESESEELMEL